MFNHQYLLSTYFPSVWFAPGDDSHLTEEERQPAGAASSPKPKSKRSRVIIGTKEYYLTPFETADLLIQRSKERKEKLSKPEKVIVLKEKSNTISPTDNVFDKTVSVESNNFDLTAQVNANYAFIARLREALYKLELQEIQRQIEDDEECLMLLL